MARSQRDTLPDPMDPKTVRIETQPGIVATPPRFYEVADNGVKTWVVAPSMMRALEILSDLDLSDCEYLTITQLREESARGVRVRPDGDSPAVCLADAPMGSVFSTEV